MNRKQKSIGQSTKSSQFFSTTPHKKHQSNFKEDTQNKQLVFLRTKNKQLQQLILRMGQQLTEVYKTNHQLIGLNSKYIDNLNAQYKNNFKTFLQITRKNTKQQQSSNRFSQMTNILSEFQKDYRNLIKHCLSLEHEIKINNRDLQGFLKMKQELKMTNHTSISELVSQFLQTTHELIQFKKNNNKLQFQVQKCQQQLKKINNQKSISKKGANQAIQQLEVHKSLINTIKNEAIDKQNSYKNQIYTLQLKVERLQSEIRDLQTGSKNHEQTNNKLRIRQIQLQSRSKEKLSYTSQIRINRTNSAYKPKRNFYN